MGINQYRTLSAGPGDSQQIVLLVPGDSLGYFRGSSATGGSSKIESPWGFESKRGKLIQITEGKGSAPNGNRFVNFFIAKNRRDSNRRPRPRPSRPTPQLPKTMFGCEIIQVFKCDRTCFPSVRGGRGSAGRASEPRPWAGVPSRLFCWFAEIREATLGGLRRQGEPRKSNLLGGWRVKGGRFLGFPDFSLWGFSVTGGRSNGSQNEDLFLKALRDF